MANGHIERFDVHIGGQNGLCYPGALAKGVVQISVRSGQIVVRSLEVEITGEAKTAWVNKASDKIYETMQPYFERKVDIDIDGDGTTGDRPEEEQVLSEGTYPVPFSVMLPPGLPPSFEGAFGYIRYVCSATLLLSQGGRSHVKCQKLITMVAEAQTQAFYDRLNHPQCIDDQLELVSCCRRQLIDVRLALPQSSFFVGSKIMPVISIKNDSTRKLQNISLDLVQHARFQALSRYESVADVKESHQVVEAVVLETPIAGGATEQWAPELNVGSITPTHSIQLINVDYSLKLRIDQSELVLPVMIAWSKPA